GEVRHRPGEDGAGVDEAPALAAREIAAQPPVRLVDARLQLQVLHPAVDLLGSDALQQSDGIVIDGAPRLRRQLAEDSADVRLPGPPQVLSQLEELLKGAVGGCGHRSLETVTGFGGGLYQDGKKPEP